MRAWTVCRFKEELGDKEGVVLLREVDTPMHSMYLSLSVLCVCFLDSICIILSNSPPPLMCSVLLLSTPVLFEEPSLIESYQQIYELCKRMHLFFFINNKKFKQSPRKSLIC